MPTLSHFTVNDKQCTSNSALKIALENYVITEKLQASIPAGHKYNFMFCILVDVYNFIVEAR